MFSNSLLVYKISNERSSNTLTSFLLYVIHFFSFVACKIVFVFHFQQFDYNVYDEIFFDGI